MVKTLAELKAENAATEEVEAQSIEQPEVEQEDVDLSLPEQDEETEVLETEAEEAEEETETLGEEQTEEPLEAWMESEDNSETVPVSVLAKTRSKLKAKVNESKEEIEQLKQEIAQLKSNPQQPVKVDDLPRPKLEDFDFDEDKHAQAVDDWNLQRFEARQQKTVEQSQNDERVKQAMERIKQDSDKHYERAAELVSNGRVTAEDYQTADSNVRKMFEGLYPEAGDQMTDAVISHLSSAGDGSEKVMFYLGRNQSALNTLRAKLQADPNGFQAIAYLGTLLAKTNQSPAKKVSKAPSPTKKLQGDADTGVVTNAQRKKYNAAHKKGDIQTALSVKRAAKAAGVDTSTW
jgi:uncharacterized membrane-anchored protein YhcB (DUF1043 family)